MSLWSDRVDRCGWGEKRVEGTDEFSTEMASYQHE